MKSLFEDTTYLETKKRLNKLEPTIEPKWGKMSLGQMLHHCQKPLELALQKEDFQLKPNLLAKWFFKKALYNDKPWSKGLPTPKSFKVVTKRDFVTEKTQLESLITEFHNKKELAEWPAHPVFGKFTPEQWGKMQYKHLDHHLRQFGV